jgi:alpha-L-arabinofuranosidase
MNCLILTALLSAVVMGADAQAYVPSSAADSAWIFAYSTHKNKDHNGLHFAWSGDCVTWHEIGPEHSFVQSDYGNWGPQKRMMDPSLRQTADGTWELIFKVNEKEPRKRAYTSSGDLVHWLPQDYYEKDFWQAERDSLILPSSGKVGGEIHKVPMTLVRGLLNEMARVAYNNTANAERLVDDSVRFKGLNPQKTRIRVSTENAKPISDKLLGIFFEDISYAADGGLYAELIENRDFEYTPRDNRRDSNWNAKKAWGVEGDAGFDIADENPIHENNPHYAVFKTSGNGALTNTGWDGIVVRKNARYDFSLFGRTANGKTSVKVELLSPQDEVLATAMVSVAKGEKWGTAKAVLKAKGDCDKAHLRLTPQASGTYHFDMVSLFPQDTWNHRKNGLRKDMMQVLYDMKPGFVRFPGGCVSHGDGLDNLYRWKNTVGPLEARKPNFNIWRYHQTVGLGYYEYFLMCEDLGAEPLPVLAAGVPCQNSAEGGLGQQGGIPMDQMDEYTQDVLDLIEYANGDPKTSQWAKLRADAGHPKPFNLKMIGIGNEDMITRVFEERFEYIFKAVKAKYPDIEVVGTVGPFFEGSDYEEGWRFAKSLNVDIVDEHYYCPLGWFLNHSDFYDSYQRGGPRVYLGEYSAQVPAKVNCLESALAEAHYLCNVERNADVVSMISYAPLFAKRGYARWNPDMIYFDNTNITLTAGYQVQKLFGNYAGQTYLPSSVAVEGRDSKLQRRLAASCVEDKTTGDLIVKVANLLPVTNEVTIELPKAVGLKAAETLTGRLEAVEVAPVPLEGASLSGNVLQATLDAYSFTVFRVSTK